MVDSFARMRQLVGTTAEWAANDIVLKEGEIAVERIGVGDVRAKCGNGTLKWSELPYLSGTAIAVDAQVAAASAHAATATTQAGISTTKAAEALASANAAAASYDSFDDRYLGAKATAPTLDNDGNALLTGAIYWNTTSSQMFVRSSSAWINYEATSVAAAATATTQAGIATTQAGTATTQAGIATSAAATATTQAGLATTARTGAETARDAAFVNANVYANTTAGLAAVALNEQFQVVSGDEIIRYREDAGPVATEVARYPSYEYVEDIYRERILASKANFFVKSVERTNYAKRAAILVMVGQSNNVPRGTPISGSVSSDVLMPVGGNSMTYWPYNAVNAEWVAQYADVASAVTDAQGASENPGSGMALAMLGGTFSRVYMCSVAAGSSSFTRLQSTGLIHNCFAVINRLCDIARADGFEPYVVFDTHHGETAAFNGDSEATYYSQGWKYYRQIQAFAANAMDRRDYDAPIVFHMPIAYGTFGTAANMRNVARAIVRLARDIPGGILLGGSYQFLASDGVHHTNIAVRQKGEYGGMLARDYFAKADTAQCLQMVDAVWGGTTVTVTFNEEITYDTGLTFGTSLNTANALGGFEFFDDATPIKVNSIAVQGRKAVLTLNATPTGTTQTVQIASQAMTGLPSTFPTVAGSQVRTTSTSPVGIYDHTKTYYDLAAPQTIEARP